MSDESGIGALDDRLDALDKPIRNWLNARERAFAASFGPREGKLSNLMSRLPKAAATSAGVGTGPREEVFALLDEVSDVYARSDAQRCAVIRGVIHRHEARELLEAYIGHAAEMLEKSGRPEWLERAVAVASIEDQRRDYRDWLVAIGNVYVAAFKGGLDATPVLKRMAERSNAEGHPATKTPTREALERFDRSAYFGTSVLPRLR
ncbi:MAG TPA: hypothetical protein VGR87_07825 [Candidatus Limnocylindria bacterium]|jgi:hypothetical protein|nr:hypothetical protein [Candidatus Limnocylindria bacterium]